MNPMGFWRKLFGVTRGTHQAVVEELATLRLAHEALSNAKKAEIRLRAAAERRLSKLMSDHDRLLVDHARQRKELDAKTREVEILVPVNRKLSEEVAKLRDLEGEHP